MPVIGMCLVPQHLSPQIPLIKKNLAMGVMPARSGCLSSRSASSRQKNVYQPEKPGRTLCRGNGPLQRTANRQRNSVSEYSLLTPLRTVTGNLNTGGGSAR